MSEYPVCGRNEFRACLLFPIPVFNIQDLGSGPYILARPLSWYLAAQTEEYIMAAFDG